MIDPGALEEDGLRTDLHIQASYRLTEALVASENKMRRRIELLSEVIFEIDASGTILFLNSAWERILGFPIEPSIGANLFHYVHEEDRPRLRQYFENPPITEITQPCEIRFVGKAGDLVTMEVSASRLEENAWVGALHNVTQRNLARSDLAKLSLVASNTDSLVIITDGKGQTEWVNAAFTRKTGYELEECIGKKPGSYLQGPETSPQTIQEIREAMRNSQSFQCEILNYTKAGEKYWVSIFGTPVLNSRGRVERYVSVQNDTTAIRQMQNDLSIAKDVAERASQAKTVFLAAMSHEIRTPLNGVLGMVSLLAEGNLDKDQREQTDVIRKSGEALVTIVNDILDYSKIEAGRFSLASETFRLKAVLDDCLDLFKGTAHSQGLRLLGSYSGDPSWHVKGDLGRLRQIVTNLISNALKFTKDGEVKVEMSAEQTEEVTSLAVSVTDTGVGIAEKDLDRLFVHFSQVDDSHTRKVGGTGLGLAISKQLVEMMGGEIGVVSQRDQGSRFWFRVELPTAVCKAIAPGPPEHVNLSLKGRRILIAEDNVVNQMVLEGILNTFGGEIEIVENGRQALERAKAGDLDFIFMDVQMPEMDGIEATRQIRQFSDVPIVAVTASVLQEQVESCRQSGMNGFVSKPVGRKALENELVRFLRPSVT